MLLREGKWGNVWGALLNPDIFENDAIAVESMQSIINFVQCILVDDIASHEVAEVCGYMAFNGRDIDLMGTCVRGNVW